jgi:uncharacterized lipoprotein YmbA
MQSSTRIFLSALCLVMLAGCGVSKPSRFYILTPVAGEDAMAMTGTAPSLGIGPVRFPAYLDRPEIAHRSGDNQLHYAGTHRWAEPLKNGFTRALAENLSVLLPTDHIALHPWSRVNLPDYQVILDITRFDADSRGTVILSGSWELVRSGDNPVIRRERFSKRQPAGGLDYPAIVSAQSRALQDLSREIATAIRDADPQAGR